MDLIIRPTTISGQPRIRWALQLRNHSCCGETEYATITRVSDATAHEILEAGAPYPLFDKPPSDWREELAQLEPEAMTRDEMLLEIIRLRTQVRANPIAA